MISAAATHVVFAVACTLPVSPKARPRRAGPPKSRAAARPFVSPLSDWCTSFGTSGLVTQNHGDKTIQACEIAWSCRVQRELGGNRRRGDHEIHRPAAGLTSAWLACCAEAAHVAGCQGRR
jgi:hypothetical protein